MKILTKKLKTFKLWFKYRIMKGVKPRDFIIYFDNGSTMYLSNVLEVSVTEESGQITDLTWAFVPWDSNRIFICDIKRVIGIKSI